MINTSLLITCIFIHENDYIVDALIIVSFYFLVVFLTEWETASKKTIYNDASFHLFVMFD